MPASVSRRPINLRARGNLLGRIGIGLVQFKAAVQLVVPSDAWRNGGVFESASPERFTSTEAGNVIRTAEDAEHHCDERSFPESIRANNQRQTVENFRVEPARTCLRARKQTVVVHVEATNSRDANHPAISLTGHSH